MGVTMSKLTVFFLFLLFLTIFFWLIDFMILKLKKLEKTDDISIFNRIFSPKYLLYPIFLILMAFFIIPQLGGIKPQLSGIKPQLDEEKYYEILLNKLVEANQIAEDVSKILLGDLSLVELDTLKNHYISKITNIYLEVIHDGRAHLLHQPLWETFTNIKESFVKKILLTDKKFVKNANENFRVTKWFSRRFIEGRYYEAITKITIVKNNPLAHNFNIYLGAGPFDSQKYWQKFYVKSQDSNIEEKNYGREITNYTIADSSNYSGMKNFVITIPLNKNDFKNNSTIITRVSKYEQLFPFSIHSSETYRYMSGVDQYTIETYFKNKIDDYDIGYIYPEKGEIIWRGNKNFDKFLTHSESVEMVDWGIDTTGQTISAYKYICDFQLDPDKAPIFKYRQNWKDWGYNRD